MEGPRGGQDIERRELIPDMFPMGWAVGQDAHEEAREEGLEEGQVCQENFGEFVIEIAYSPISIRPYLGPGPGGL